MFGTLRKKLIFFYTFTSGLILTAVLILVIIIGEQQLLNNKIEGFMNDFNYVAKSVQLDNIISSLWIAELEMNNQSVIHIEENGKEFLYKGAFKTSTGRSALIQKVKALAEEDTINTRVKLVSVKEVQSKIYKLKGSKNDKYLGAVFMVQTKNGTRSVVMLKDISESTASAVTSKLLTILLGIAGIGGLFFLSRWTVGNSLKPVEDSRKSQTEFIAAASHELKAPLAVISANASVLRIETERAEHYIKGIENECRRLSNLVEDLLLLASADANTWKARKEAIDTDTLLIEIYDVFYPFCLEHGKALSLEVEEELLPGIEGDRERMKQVLAILIDNAVSYSKEEDTILLRGCRKKNNVCLEVVDHGKGISPEKKKKVFERFYREDKGRSDKNHFGLGLSIAKELIELQGGNLVLTDTKGGGATFCICFPIRLGEAL